MSQYSERKQIKRSHKQLNTTTHSMTQFINRSKNSQLITTKQRPPPLYNPKLQPNNNTAFQSRQKQQQQSQHSKSKQKLQKNNIFYSELHIETNDIDVPLVKILKVNQQLMKKFIYYTNSLELMFKLHNIKSINYAFRRVASNMLLQKNYCINVYKLNVIFQKFTQQKLEQGLRKLISVRNKHNIKQKALIVIKRLIITKINNYCRQFIKNCYQKRIMSIVMQKSDEDQMLKLKMNMEIMRQITFSKEFVMKCRSLMRYNVGKSLSVFQREIGKVNLQQCIRMQLERYQKLRQNVDNRNPSVVNSSKSLPKRKPLNSSGVSNNDSLLYENEIVLMIVRSFNLSLGDMKRFYQEKILHLQNDIEQMRSQQRYIQLQQSCKQEQVIRLQYENVINDIYKIDQLIRKIYNQYKQCVERKRDWSEVMNRLCNNLESQYKKYQQLWSRIQSSKVTSKQDEVIRKLYMGRCLYMEMCNTVINSLHSIYQHKIQTMKQSYLQLQKQGAKEKIEYQSQTQLIPIQSIFIQTESVYTQVKQALDINESEQNLSSNVQISTQTHEIDFNSYQTQTDEINSTYTITQTDGIQAHNVYIETDSASISPKQSIQIKLAKAVTENKQIQTTSIKQSNQIYTQTDSEKQQKNIFAIQQHKLQSLINSQQLSKILKQKLQYYERQCQQIENKLVIKSQQCRLIETQNRQITFKIAQLQRQLSNYKNQQIDYNKRQVSHRLIIQKMRSEVQLYSSENKKEIQQNSMLNKQIYELNRKLIQTNRQLQMSNSERQSLKMQVGEYVYREKQLLILVERNKKQNHNKENHEQKDNKGNHEQKKTQLQLELQSYQLVSRNQQEQLQQQQQQQQQLLVEFQKRQIILKQQLLSLRQQIQHLQTVTLQEQSSNDKLRQQSYEFKSHLHKLQMQNREKQFIIQTQQIQLNSLALKIKQFSTIEVTYQKEIERLHQHTNSLQQQISVLNIVIKQFNVNNKKKDTNREGKSSDMNKQNISIEISGESDIKKQRQVMITESLQRKQDNKLSETAVLIIKLQKQNEKLLSKIEEINLKLKQSQDKMSQRQKQLIQSQKRLIQSQNTIRQIRKQKQYKINLTIIQYEKQTNRLKQFYNKQLAEFQLVIKNQKQFHEKTQAIYKERLEQLSKESHSMTIKRRDQFHDETNTNDNIIGGVDIEYQQKKQQKKEQHNNNKNHSQTHVNQWNTPITTLPITTIFNNYHIVSYNPQQQIRSLKQFIFTLQTQNSHLNNKYQKLKKQLYSDNQISTIHSSTNLNERNESISFYENLVHQLKRDNDRLYDQLLRIKNFNNKSNQDSSRQIIEDEINDKMTIQMKIQIHQQKQVLNNELKFLNNELRNKKLLIEQQQSIINSLRIKLQEYENSVNSNQIQIKKQKIDDKQVDKEVEQMIRRDPYDINRRIQNFQQQRVYRQRYFQQKQHNYQLAIQRFNQQIRELRKREKQHNSQLKQMEQFIQQQMRENRVDYDRVLLLFKQAKHLFTEYTKGYNKVISTIGSLQQRIVNHNAISTQVKNNMNMSINYSSSQLLAVINEFKSIVEENSQVMLSVYQRLGERNVVKSSLEMHYLKELAFNIVARFYLPFYNDTDRKYSTQNNQHPTKCSTYTELVSSELQREIKLIFVDGEIQNKIEQVLVGLEEFIIDKLQLSLDSYKQQLHTKALQLSHIKQQLNQIIIHNLREQNLLINTLPIQPYGEQMYLNHYHDSSNHRSDDKIQQYPIKKNNFCHPKKSNNNEPPHLQAPHNSLIENSPYSNNYVSKTSSSYQYKPKPSNQSYRPQTSLIDKYDLMEQSLPSSDRVLLYRSQAK